MKFRYLTILIVTFVFQKINSQSACDLVYLTSIESFDVYQHSTSGAILYRAKFAVDADGCPRAYGPNDSGLDWTANAGYTGNWWGVVTDAYGDPVIQGAGDPYPGMYVSTTSLVQSGYANTNPLRYVDSENIPYIALPSALQSMGNISMGDLVYVKNSQTGTSCYAYLADTGPSGKLGEGSIYLANTIDLNGNPRTGGTSAGIIDYIVFPQSGMGQGTLLSIQEIDSIGQNALNAAGGLGLVTCFDNLFALDCSNSIPLQCGVTYSGSSSNAISHVETYGCNSWTESGPERVHSIIPSANGTITATVSNYTGDLDVYILASCDANDCVGTVGSTSATYSNAIAGHTYYIVVDADDGSGSAYDLVVDCPTATTTDDIFISNEAISIDTIHAGQSITVTSYQNYSGAQNSSALPPIVLGYYLSSDCNLSQNDVLLGSDTSQLGSNSPNSLETSNLIISSSTIPGNYYILFVADNGNDLIEANENNNINCVSIVVEAPILDCSSAIALSCGVTYSGGSSNAVSVVDTYGCNSWTETGPERIHSFIPSTNGQIGATISNYSGDLDVYILSGCDASNCVGTVTSSAATLDSAVAGSTYYIVVDADDGSGSAYDLLVTCDTSSSIDIIEKVLKNEIQVYPNPFENNLTIQISNFKKGSQPQFILYNLLGEIITSNTITSDKSQVSLEHIEQGVYLICIFSDGNMIDSKRIIKE